MICFESLKHPFYSALLSAQHLTLIISKLKALHNAFIFFVEVLR